jgi:MoxR-like ATPase
MAHHELDDIKPRDALNIVCLFFAQSDIPKAPHLELGYASQKEAFVAVAAMFRSNPHTVKLTRDAFDRYTESGRVGWKDPLRPELQSIFDKYSGLDRPSLRSLVEVILANYKGLDMTLLGGLPNLEQVISECRTRLAKQDPSKEIRLDQATWMKIAAAYRDVAPSDSVEVIGGHTFKIKTPDNKNLSISCQEIPECWAVIPYVHALDAYEQKIRELNEFLVRFFSPAKVRAALAELPSSTWRTDVDAEVLVKIDEWVNDTFQGDETSKEYFAKFVSEKQTQNSQSWSGVSKQLSRTDWTESAIVYVGGWLAVGAARRGNLAEALARDASIDGLIEAAIESAASSDPEAAIDGSLPRLTGGENRIYYGAPGTGKSYTIDQIVSVALPQFAIRTVFHPDTQNSDFIGALKPVAIEGTDITYRFSPGPFSAALIAAYKDPGNFYWLIIEELNRAPAAAVFGELFLLLDRRADGSGQYDVSFPSEEFGSWWTTGTGDKSGKFRLPSNLSILATMNSADQGVFPLDTAFRRRWSQEYVAIDYATCPEGTITLASTATEKLYPQWRDFISQLNSFLVDEIGAGISEDRLVGPWFLSKSELGGRLPGKLMIYLWDDLLRHHGREILFRPNVKTYGDLARSIVDDAPIFTDRFLARFSGVALSGE